MRFNSSIFLSLILIALFYALFRRHIDISYIFFSIALIENSLSLRFYPISKRVADQNDFRFSYAEVASKIYYPISLIFSYFIYIFIINFYKDSSSFEVIYLLVVLSLFTIFRITINEILNYLENKNLIKNKSLIDLKVAREINRDNKTDILDQIKLIKNASLKIQEIILLDNIYNHIKYSSIEIDYSILDDLKELNQIIRSDKEENSLIEAKLKQINNKL